jgi:hypothetical protein
MGVVMQGIIFNALEEFVLESASMEVWNDVLDACQLASDGVYTAGITYDDAEVLALATALCGILNVSVNDGLKLFGVFLFDFLLKKGPIELHKYEDTPSLLLELESVVHRDVKRINPDAYTPLFEYTAITKDTGSLSYYSKRKLCVVAEGLLAGAAKHYNQTVTMKHTQCMHDDFDKCIWDVIFA